MSSQTPQFQPDSIDDQGHSDAAEDTLASQLSGDGFETWRIHQERQRNLDEGYNNRNDPSDRPAPEDHSPSQIFGCARQNAYRRAESPAEERNPYGVFAFGHLFEDLFENYLKSILSGPQYVANPIHIDFEEDGLRIVGSTDNVVVGSDGTPIALTEQKTTKNLYYIRENGIKKRHKAQLFAYARGLVEKYDLDEYPELLIAYGSRESLEVEVFSVEFDPDFWSRVVENQQAETEARRDDDLEPEVQGEENQWLCEFCDFQQRCGGYEPGDRPSWENGGWTGDVDYWKNDDVSSLVRGQFSNEPHVGFIPGVKHPRSDVVGHLLAYPSVNLTPTVATLYPELATDGPEPTDELEARYGEVPQADVHDWVCTSCGTEVKWDTPDFDGDLDEMPNCPDCLSPMRGPAPSELTDE